MPQFSILSDFEFSKLIYCSNSVDSNFCWWHNIFSPVLFKYSNSLKETGNFSIFRTKNSFWICFNFCKSKCFRISGRLLIIKSTSLSLYTFYIIVLWQIFCLSKMLIGKHFLWKSQDYRSLSRCYKVLSYANCEARPQKGMIKVSAGVQTKFDSVTESHLIIC